MRTASGPGQSLQPVSIGLGGSGGTAPTSCPLVWSDGILQTEIDLEGGRLHRIEETQRQLSSCPVLFAYDGTGFRFVTDILGVGGIGFLERPGSTVRHTRTNGSCCPTTPWPLAMAAMHW